MAKHKHRIPYGYQISSGIAEIDETAGTYVKRLFTDYTSGIPQYKLPESLRSYAVENGWEPPAISQEMLKKILTDPRYLGDEMYPRLIEEAVFQQAQEVRAERIRKIGKDQKYMSFAEKEKFLLHDKIVCGECGKVFNRYKRKQGKKNRIFVWDCSGRLADSRIACYNIRLTDEQVQHAFLCIANRLKDQPKLLELPPKKTIQQESTRLKGINKQIQRMEQQKNPDAEEWIRLIFKRASLQYEAAEADRQKIPYHTEKIREALKHTKDMTAFQEELFLTLTDRIVAYRDGRLKFILKNGAEIEYTLKT